MNCIESFDYGRIFFSIWLNYGTGASGASGASGTLVVGVGFVFIGGLIVVVPIILFDDWFVPFTTLGAFVVLATSIGVNWFHGYGSRPSLY